jgi:hypothetical protein
MPAKMYASDAMFYQFMLINTVLLTSISGRFILTAQQLSKKHGHHTTFSAVKQEPGNTQEFKTLAFLYNRK